MQPPLLCLLFGDPVLPPSSADVINESPFPFPSGEVESCSEIKNEAFSLPLRSPFSPFSSLPFSLSLVHSFSFPFAPKVLLLPPLAATQKFIPLCGGKAVGAQGIVAALRATGSSAMWQRCHYVTDCCNVFEHQNQKWLKSPSLAICRLKNQLDKNPSIAKLGDFLIKIQLRVQDWSPTFSLRITFL